MFSHTGHVMTLANSIIGVGILAMPFCFQKCGIILAIFLLIISNWITRICCHYLIKSSLLTRRKSFEFLGFHTFGSSGKLFVELCIIGYLLGACITYFVVVGDLGPQIVTKMFALDRGFTNLRLYFMFAVTLICVLPLAMLKNVDSLSAVCTASIGFYICLVIKIIAESQEHILANDWTTKVVYWRPAGILQCLPIFSMALSCQMQLFEVFKSVNNQSVEKLNGIVRDATWICTLVYIATGFFGYVAFCNQSFSGNILLNFSPSLGSDVIKIGFVVSIVFSFPLVLFPCRASIYSLLYRKGHTDASAGSFMPEIRFKLITTFIVGVTLCIALMIPFVELIIGLVGSTIGIAICVMFPAATFRKITKKNQSDRSLALSGIILFSGFCLMVLCTYANLQAIDEQQSGAQLDDDNLPNKLINPTAMPFIKEEVQKLLNDKLNVLEAKESYQIENSKLPQADENKMQKPNQNTLEKNIKIEEAVDSTSKILVAARQAPVLPVDETHQNEDSVKKQAEKATNMEKPEISGNKDLNAAFENPKSLDMKTSNTNLKKSIDGEESIKLQEPLPSIALNVQSPALSISVDNGGVQGQRKKLNTTQGSVDKDAVNKDEQIVAEEYQLKTRNKNIEAELINTRNELEKTKDLLRRVDEMQEELVQQNKKTQDLVVEKLEEVAEKVEKIDRELQKKNEHDNESDLSKTGHDKHASNRILDMIAAPGTKFKAKTPKINDKDSQKNNGIIKNQDQNVTPKIEKTNEIKIIDNDNKLKKSMENKMKADKDQVVYEPLSYKTGELIENARNINKLEPSLPLPYLINATRIKPYELEEQPQLVLLSNNLPPNPIKKNNSNAIHPKVESSLAEEHRKENVDAIRRDLLQLETTKPPPNSNNLTESQKRFKRSFDAILTSDAKAEVNDANSLKSENYLKQPNIDTLLQHGSSGALDFKIKGRELKSLKTEKTKET